MHDNIAPLALRALGTKTRGFFREVEVRPFLKQLCAKGLVKKYWGGGPEQRGGGSLVFEPLVRGGSCNFQLPIGVGHPVLFCGNWHTFDTIYNNGNSFRTIKASDTLKH